MEPMTADARPSGTGQSTAKKRTALALWVLPIVFAAGLPTAFPTAHAAEPSQTLAVAMSGADHALDRPVPLYFDEKLTLVLPADVRLVLPGSADVLSTRVNGNIVAVGLVDSEFVRIGHPETSLSIVLVDGATVACRIAVAAAADPTRPHLIRFEREPAFDALVRARALETLTEWLDAPDGNLDESTHEHLAPITPAIERRARHLVAEWAAIEGFEVVDGVTRTRADFIYLTTRSVLRLGDRAVLRLGVTNRSQPTFTVGRIDLSSDGRTIEATALDVAIPQPDVPPDGRERSIAVIAPADSVFDHSLVVTVCETGITPRCVELELDRAGQ